WLIPETLRRTSLGVARVGTGVNLEADLLSRYVARQLASGRESR
ncbi:MAG: riboflavin synthase, partial [bacterium]